MAQTFRALVLVVELIHAFHGDVHPRHEHEAHAAPAISAISRGKE